MSETAPEFDLPADDGTRCALSALRGHKLVLFFYPKDDTPGCTREAVAFSEAQSEFAKRSVKVFGVSRDSLEKHQKFREKHALTVPLLSDPDAAVHQAYGAYGEKKLYGKVSVGAIRTTVVIDEHGAIQTRYPNVKVDGHVERVLRDLDAAAAV